MNFVVELPQEMPLEARPCNACSTKDKVVVHRQKSLHLRLDGNGDVFVASGILALLRTVPGMAGFEVVNEVLNAPEQKVGAVESPTLLTVSNAGRSDYYVPGRTQQESERIAQKQFIPLLEGIAEEYDKKLTAKKAEKKSTYIFGKRTN